MTLLNEEVMTAKEIATQLGISDKTVFAWIASGKLRAYKLGRLVRIPVTAVSSLITELNGSGN